MLESLRPNAGRPGAAGGGGKAVAFVPLAAVARIALEEGPNQVSHENGKRRVVVQANVRGRNLGGFVADAQRRIDAEVKLPAGYWTEWGGQFENLLAARQRLLLVVPLALGLVFALLFVVRGEREERLLIFTGVPLALTGGVMLRPREGCPCRSRRPSGSSRSRASPCSTAWSWSRSSETSRGGMPRHQAGSRRLDRAPAAGAHDRARRGPGLRPDGAGDGDGLRGPAAAGDGGDRGESCRRPR